MPSSRHSLWRSTTSSLRWLVGRSTALVAKLSRSGLFGASTVSVIDQAVVSATNFATSVIIGRACGSWELGAYYLALTVVLFTRGVQEQLVGAPYMIYSPRRKGTELESFGGSALVHQVVLSLTVATLLLAAWGLDVVPQDLKPVAAVLIGALPLLLMREFVREMSFARLKPGVALAVDVSVGAGQLGLLAVLGYLQMLTVPLAFLIMGIACGVASLGWFLKKHDRLVGYWRGAWNDWWHNWTFSRWALASQMLGSTTAYIMPWVLAAAHGEEATGVFGACATLVGLANMFVMGCSNFLSPRAAHAYVEGGLAELRAVLWKMAALFIVTLGSFVVGAFLLGEWVAVLLYDGPLEGSWLIIGVLSIGVLANGLSMICGNGLWAMERPAANFSADVCVMLTVIVGAATLIPLWGALGAAIATLLAHLTAVAVRGWTLNRLMREAAQREVAP